MIGDALLRIALAFVDRWPRRPIRVAAEIRRQRIWLGRMLSANLFADSILLLVQGALFSLGDVPTILTGLSALFLANSVAFSVKLMSLAFGDLPLPGVPC